MSEEPKAERRYSVTSINIRRPYGKDGDYDATVNVMSAWGDEIKIKLPEDRIEAMINSVSDLIVDTLSQQLTNMREDFIQHQEEKQAKLNPPSVEAEVVEEDTPVEVPPPAPPGVGDSDDDVPF